jgi:hypothetical protein
LNHIFVSGQVLLHSTCCEYLDWTVYFYKIRQHFLYIIHRYWNSNLNSVNDCGIGFEPHICVLSGIVTFNNLLVSFLDDRLLLYDTKSSFALSTDTSIEIWIKWTTVVSVLNDIFVSRQVWWYSKSCWYHYWTAYLDDMTRKLAVPYPPILVFKSSLSEWMWCQF